MELLNNLEIVEVKIVDGTAEITCLDDTAGNIYTINLRKTQYDAASGKYLPDEKKAERAEEKAQEWFGVSFDELPDKILGQFKDVYVYDDFASFDEMVLVEKFDKADEGLIFQTAVLEVFDDGRGIHIRYEYEDKMRQSNMGYANYDDTNKRWLVDPIKKKKQYKRFAEKFNCEFDEANDKLVGEQITVEIKTAFGKPYGDIKKLPKKK